MMHVLLHLFVGRSGTRRDRVERRNSSLQINCYAHLVQQIDAEDSINFSSARVPNWTQIDSR